MESATGDGLADAMKNMQNDPGKFSWSFLNVLVYIYFKAKVIQNWMWKLTKPFF